MSDPKKKIVLPCGTRFIALDNNGERLSWTVFEVVAIETDTLHMEVRVVSRCTEKDDALTLARMGKIQEQD